MFLKVASITRLLLWVRAWRKLGGVSFRHLLILVMESVMKRIHMLSMVTGTKNGMEEAKITVSNGQQAM